MYYASKFDFENLQRVKFYTGYLNTRQILNWFFHNVSAIECISFAICHVFLCSFKRGSFGNVLIYGVGSVNQVVFIT